MPDEPDWKTAREMALRNLAELTPEENAAITAAAEADPDNPPLDEETLSRMRPAAPEDDPDEAPDLSTPQWQARFAAARLCRGEADLAEFLPTERKKRT